MNGVARASPLTGTRARRTVATVLRGERAPDATASVAFLSSQQMRALNRRTFGRDHATDVIAFGLTHGHQLVADIYVCPAVARREARTRRVPVVEELERLLVHGTLHAAGWDHPEGDERERSSMWRRQEQYVLRLRGGT